MSNYTSLLAVSVIGLGCTAGPASTSSKKSQPPTEREVHFAGAGGMELDGTFLAPSTKKSPAVLLLPGSGPTDRDGNSIVGGGMTTNVLKQIADRLAAEGIASLRFDKRAIAHYKSAWPKAKEQLNAFFGWQKFVDDAKSAYAFMKQQPEVDPARTGILGHSEGSLITLQIESDLSQTDSGPKAIILLGSTGRPMGPILHEQIARLLKKQGASDAVGKPFLDYTDAACEALARGEALPPNTPPGLAALFNPTTADIVGAYCRIDPTVLAKRYAGPVLIVNGQDDTQVSAERDSPRLEKAFQERKTGTVEMLIVPKASHNLKSTESGDLDAFAGPIVPAALDKIAAFAHANL